MDQTQTQRYVPRFEPLDLRSRLHREGFPIHQEYRTPLSTLQCHGGNTNTIHLTKRDRPLAKQLQITSTEEGYKPTPTPPHQEGVNQQSQSLPMREQTTTQINLYQRGIQQLKGFTTKWYISTTNQFPFFTKTSDPIERIE